MNKKIRTIRDVVDWNLCIGCGACASVVEDRDAVELVDIGGVGIRPKFTSEDDTIYKGCLEVCPGAAIDAYDVVDDAPELAADDLMIGRNHGVFEGYAADEHVRFEGSSGGILSALSLYCLEHEGMDFAVHTGMDPDQPWKNRTVISRSREELLAHAGSRYCTSSPCEYFHRIEENDKPCIFIGKPCDVAALAKARRLRPELDKKVGMAFSFFCGGIPCSDAVKDLAEEMGVAEKDIAKLRFRGQGWPGRFRVADAADEEKSMAYIEAWKTLAKRRPFRCQICPDGMGQLSDITSGDAWNKYTGEGESPGLSHVVVRTARGKELLERAAAAGYLELTPSSADDIVKAQGLFLRRAVAFGRLLGMKLTGAATPEFPNFKLFQAWIRTNPIVMIRSIFGTLKRMVVRKLWKKSPLFYQ